MFYPALRRWKATDRKRVSAGLLALREQLARDLPAKDADDRLLLATWNIRDLAKVNRRGFGERLPESRYYIAEILSHFDFVAVQEVNELDEWEEIMDILGHDWGYIATDVSDPSLGGNGERLTYLYDRRKVSFQNIAGEIVLPAKQLISENVTPEKGDAEAKAKVASKSIGRQFSRSPFTALFQAGWFKFEICSVHIYYGSESGAKLRRRVSEIKTIARYFGERAKRDVGDRRSLILLGDFNVVHPEHETMKALLASGFKLPAGLEPRATNVDRSKYYDQIVFRLHPDAPKQTVGDSPTAGAFDIYERLFTPEQFPAYKKAAAATANGSKARDEAALEKYYREWRTYQLSDHMPLWVQLRVNDSDAYLSRLG
jgi:endonuclease/exonuclease/phosphatase family metal-dependent hydrolase